MIQEHVDLQRFIYLWKEQSLTAWSILPTAETTFRSCWGRPGVCFFWITKSKRNSSIPPGIPWALFLTFHPVSSNSKLTRARNLIHENIHDTCDMLCKALFHLHHYWVCKLLNDGSFSICDTEQHNTCLWSRLYWHISLKKKNPKPKATLELVFREAPEDQGITLVQGLRWIKLAPASSAC